MTEAEVKHLNQWIEKAEHDLIAAKLIIEATRPVFNAGLV